MGKLDVGIVTDDDLLDVLNDLKHSLKAGLPYSKLRGDFNEALNKFIEEHGLDHDPHSFAEWPKPAST